MRIKCIKRTQKLNRHKIKGFPTFPIVLKKSSLSFAWKRQQTSILIHQKSWLVTLKVDLDFKLTETCVFNFVYIFHVLVFTKYLIINLTKHHFRNNVIKNSAKSSFLKTQHFYPFLSFSAADNRETAFPLTIRCFLVTLIFDWRPRSSNWGLCKNDQNVVLFGKS